jgi:hypothetical protein
MIGDFFAINYWPNEVFYSYGYKSDTTANFDRFDRSARACD